MTGVLWVLALAEVLFGDEFSVLFDSQSFAFLVKVCDGSHKVAASSGPECNVLESLEFLSLRGGDA